MHVYRVTLQRLIGPKAKHIEQKFLQSRCPVKVVTVKQDDVAVAAYCFCR